MRRIENGSHAARETGGKIVCVNVYMSPHPLLLQKQRGLVNRVHRVHTSQKFTGKFTMSSQDLRERLTATGVSQKELAEREAQVEGAVSTAEAASGTGDRDQVHHCFAVFLRIYRISSISAPGGTIGGALFFNGCQKRGHYWRENY